MSAVAIESIECPYTVGETIAVKVSDVRFSFNTRHGWNESEILPAYAHGIEELKQSILDWGYKKNEPIEVYPMQDENGEWHLELEEGHRRFYTSKLIFSEDPETILGDGLLPGEIWGYVTKPPASLLRKLASQRDANKSLGNTSLDIAKAINTLMDQKDVEGETTKTGKEKIIGKVYGLTRQQVGVYNKVYSLPTEILDWIQEGELDPHGESITLSFTWASRVITEYGADAPKLLLKVKEMVDKTPEKVDTHGRSIKESFLHSLADKMGFGSKKKKSNAPVKPIPQSHPTEATTVNTPTHEQSGSSETTGMNLPSWVGDTTTKPNNVDGTPAYKTGMNLPSWVGDTTTKPNNVDGTPAYKTDKIASTTAEKKPTPTSTLSTEDKIKGLAIKALEKLAPYIVDGRSDATQGLYIVSLPIDLGEDFAELVASMVDPLSNPPELSAVNAKSGDTQTSEETSAETSAIEDLEF